MEKVNTNSTHDIALQNQWCADYPVPKTGKDTLRMLFCRQGNVAISLNDTLYELGGGNILIASPGDAMKVIGYGPSFSGSYLAVSLRLLEQFSLFSPQNWRTYSAIKDKQQLCLEECNIQILQSYLHLLEARLKHPALADNRAGLYALLSTFIRDFLNIAAKQYREQEYGELSAANNLFNKFIHLLYASAPQKADIGYYAGKSCA